jgi:hypothetical protein
VLAYKGRQFCVGCVFGGHCGVEFVKIISLSVMFLWQYVERVEFCFTDVGFRKRMVVTDFVTNIRILCLYLAICVNRPDSKHEI